VGSDLIGSVSAPSAIGILYRLTDSFYAAFVAGPILATVCMLFVYEAKAGE